MPAASWMRYHEKVLTFNDDIQGSGAVNLAAVLSGVAASGLPLREHRIVVFGAGTAGIGVADQLRDALVADGLSPEQATARIWALDRHGLLTAGQRDIRDFQLRYARAAADVEGWHHDDAISGIPLAEVVARVRPTILIGTSGQGGAFTEDIVRTMAAHADRPIILPMSNPTRLAEAVPADLLAWSEGRALIATGSPFGPVDQGGVTYQVGQANNALVFPGLGLGALVAEADRVTDAMLTAAAHAVAAQTDATIAGAPILPLITQLHETSVAVAVAVARAAADDGVARATVDERIEERIRAAMWTPSYRPIRAV
ncbi:oxaloacetate-decarboxylating malate dehydrogenase [Actinacidiphila sp. bgisy167]|uniref:oxaloacetate-decarboxylating malate dehydrogenase n=1 Tax=Actinacidiphila sp. bgisy167 TaxID=3413797 RepID=UPI003D70DC9E